MKLLPHMHSFEPSDGQFVCSCGRVTRAEITAKLMTEQSLVDRGMVLMAYLIIIAVGAVALLY